MKKKVLAMLMVAAMAVSMVACGGKKEEAKADSAPAAEEETADEEEEEEDAAADTDADADADADAEEDAAPAGDVTYADVTAPAGKVLRTLPVDKAADENIRIASVCVQNNPWGAAVMVGQNFAKDTLADFNCTVDVISVESFDALLWNDTIENCVAAGYDAVCYMGLSDDLLPATGKAIAADIPVFLFNCDLPDTGRIAMYGINDVLCGNNAGEFFEEALPDGGKWAIITGDFSVTGHENRRKGAREILDANDKFELIGEYQNDDDAQKAYDLTTDILTANPDLAALFVTAGGPAGAAQALIDNGREDVILVCFDCLSSISDYIADGVINACIDQDPFNQGYQPIVDAYNYVVAGIVPAEVPDVYDAIIATPDNVKDLFPEYF